MSDYFGMRSIRRSTLSPPLQRACDDFIGNDRLAAVSLPIQLPHQARTPVAQTDHRQNTTDNEDGTPAASHLSSRTHTKTARTKPNTAIQERK